MDRMGWRHRLAVGEWRAKEKALRKVKMEPSAARPLGHVELDGSDVGK